MISEFVVGIAVLRANHASDARMASRCAIRFNLDPVCQASRDVPSRWKRYRAGRTGIDAASRNARRAWIEGERRTRGLEFDVGQERGAKRQPRSVNRMQRYPDNAGADKTCELRRFHEVERRLPIHKWIDRRRSRARRADLRGNTVLYNQAYEIVEWIVSIHPSRMVGGETGAKALRRSPRSTPLSSPALALEHGRRATRAGDLGAAGERRPCPSHVDRKSPSLNKRSPAAPPGIIRPRRLGCLSRLRAGYQQPVEG